MIQFHFRHSQVIGIDISGEETLNISFTLYTAAYGRVVLLSTDNKVQSEMPSPSKVIIWQPIYSFSIVTGVFLWKKTD